MNTNHSSPRAAFTLVELLVIIGMVALGALMLVPALARTKPNSPAIQCLNNLEQLQRALAMYAADNSGKQAENLGGFTYDTNAWCTGVLDWGSGYGGLPGEVLPPNINTDYLLKSALGPYTGSRASVYKCPEDKVPSAVGPRVRSYSMNCFVGCTDYASLLWFPPGYRVFLKDSDFTKPGPAMTWVFIDEHPDGINDSMIAMNMPPYTFWPTYTVWDDMPASYHNGACGFSFADGHAEIHKWLDPQSLAPVQRIDGWMAGIPGVNGYGTTSIHDNAWMAARATAPK
jgi:prepilin-type processing-associated H-X9-DG protein